MSNMFSEYIEVALERAVYKTIDDEEPIFFSVPELPGAWATGKTAEEARKELISAIGGWIALRLRMERSIPPIGSHTASQSNLGPRLLLPDKVVPVPGFIENLDLNLADTIQSFHTAPDLFGEVAHHGANLGGQHHVHLYCFVV